MATAVTRQQNRPRAFNPAAKNRDVGWSGFTSKPGTAGMRGKQFGGPWGNIKRRRKLG